MDLRSRWPLDEAPQQEPLYRELVSRYQEPHRHYHTLQHLEECFARFDELHDLAQRPDEVTFALWFHDAIYDPRRSDNEQRSADWAKASLPAGVGGRVHALVMATRHEAVPEGIDAQVLVDVDLSILGAPLARFDEYERQVREEYAWVPGPIYRRKRREILESFLARRTIYSTARFIERYEAPARANLARSLARR